MPSEARKAAEEAFNLVLPLCGAQDALAAALEAAWPHFEVEIDRAVLAATDTATAAERGRLFVAIRHAISLDTPWRGEALDLIAAVWRTSPKEDSP